MTYGTVDNFIEDFEVPWEWKIQIMCDVSDGMLYLHQSNPAIIHGDLKCSNILISDEFRAKISDFGLARTTQALSSSRNETGQTVIGTSAYIAPEYWEDPRLKKNKTFDVYGFAISSWEILSEKRAYYDFCEKSLIDVWVRKGDRPKIEDVKQTIPECPSQILELVIKCWHQQADERPAFEAIYKILMDQLNAIGNNILKSSYDNLKSQISTPQTKVTNYPSGELITFCITSNNIIMISSYENRGVI